MAESDLEKELEAAAAALSTPAKEKPVQGEARLPFIEAVLVKEEKKPEGDAKKAAPGEKKLSIIQSIANLIRKILAPITKFLPKPKPVDPSKGFVATGEIDPKLLEFSKGIPPEVVPQLHLEKALETVLFAPVSKDRYSRRMSVLFFLASLAALTTTVMIWVHYRNKPAGKHVKTAFEEGSENLGEFLKKEADISRERASWTVMGSFLVQLTTPETRSGQKIKGVFNLAELELVAQCDLKATCEYVDNNLTLFRDKIMDILHNVERDEIMTAEGKRKMKVAILARMNSLLPKGKIREIYFTKFLLS